MEDKAIKQVESFMTNWKQKKFVEMFDNSQITWKEENKQGDIKILFKDLKLESFEVLGTKKIGKALIGVATEMKINGETAVSNVMVVFENGKYNAHPNGLPGVNPISVLRYKFIESSPVEEKPIEKAKTAPKKQKK